MAMIKLSRSFLLLTGLLLAGSLTAQSEDSAPLDQKALVADLQSLFEAARQGNQFLCQAVATRNGKEIFSFASNEEDFTTRRPVSDSTRYALGSVTKVFTGAAIQVLIQEGKLSLDDRVSELLPELTAYPEIEIQHLLFHSSGLPFGSADLRAETGVADGATMTFADLLRWIKNAPPAPLFPPGTDMSYSNVGYMLLGAIIEQTSGRSYGDFLREKIFAPLGMTSAVVQPSVLREAPEGYAIPYTVKGKKRKEKSFDYNALSEEYSQPRTTYGSSGIYMSTRDLAKVRTLWATDAVLTPASRAALTELPELANGKRNFWRYGLIRDRIGDLDTYVFRMAGNVVGFVSQVIYVPKYDLTVVACTNYYALHNKYATAEEMIDLYAEFKPLLLSVAEASR